MHPHAAIGRISILNSARNVQQLQCVFLTSLSNHAKAFNARIYKWVGLVFKFSGFIWSGVKSAVILKNMSILLLFQYLIESSILHRILYKRHISYIFSIAISVEFEELIKSQW